MIAHERGEEARLRSMQSVRSWGNRGAQENFRNGGEVPKVVFGKLSWVWRDYRKRLDSLGAQRRYNSSLNFDTRILPTSQAL